MTNSLVEDNRVALVDVDEGVLVESDMSGTFLKGLLEKNHLLSCLVSFANLLIGDQLVDIVDVDEGVKGSDMQGETCLSGIYLNGFCMNN